MSYTVTLRETDKKKVYVDPGIREGIYLYPGEIKKLKLLEGSMLEEDESKGFVFSTLCQEQSIVPLQF